MTSRASSSDWLTIPQASARLGISAQTLRQWADDGRVPSFRTPGGHRRFRSSDLASIEAGKRPHPDPTSSLQVLAHTALGRTRFALAEERMADEAWFRNVPAKAREEQRVLGRRVVMTLSELLVGEDEKTLVAQAREVGEAYALLNRKYAIMLDDSLRAFIFFREAFFESLIELTETTPALDALSLSRRLSRFVDEMLLTMVEAYDTAPVRKKK
jgi:excisionase family DNA binding protein